MRASPTHRDLMACLRRLIDAIDTATEISGRALAWLALALVLVTLWVVIWRHGFGRGSVALQEAMTYLHAGLFLLGAAYALKHGAHVRVDIFYRRFSARTRAWVDALGSILLLLPLCALIILTSLDYVAASWAIRERSPEPGGIDAVYWLKTLIPLMAANLGLQGLAELGRNLLCLYQPDEDH